MNRQNLKNSKRIVIKIGTSVLTSKDFSLDRAWISNFSKKVSYLLKQNREVVVVSSGAVAAGMHLLGLKKRPRNLPEQQACAALGQGYLMNTYEGFFKKAGFHVAQILLTWEDIRERKRYLNAKNTINTLLSKKAVPIINENDTVSVDEIKFGDNDKLSSLVANLIGADLLIMLTDVEGLCRGSECINIVSVIDSQIEKIALGTNKDTSLGGMRAKLEACKIAMNSGISCVVANGHDKGVLSKILEGKVTGTLFVPNKNKMQARKTWIAYNAKTLGKIFIDDGAKEALVKKNKSLLACGIKELEGKFVYGDVVSIMDSDCIEFAKGLSNYSSEDLGKIKGMSTKEVERIIKRNYYQEVVHRNNLVIL